MSKRKFFARALLNDNQHCRKYEVVRTYIHSILLDTLSSCNDKLPYLSLTTSPLLQMFRQGLLKCYCNSVYSVELMAGKEFPHSNPSSSCEQLKSIILLMPGHPKDCISSQEHFSAGMKGHDICAHLTHQ
ncbi:hypothetical protein KC19_10G031900 [Ceratodon purpureus]|uniref:Uncharacterized protein n=1 Tax=Ceratodon purpureus TaxID=3225 RepID=A0A8T0GHH7_CERPU|nr:hypothetical protein KC19_10G031900 [Ceratodon purpureus]